MAHLSILSTSVSSLEEIEMTTNIPANPVSPMREDSETVSSTFTGEVDTNPDFPGGIRTIRQTSYVLPTPRRESGAEIRPVTGDQTADFKENACATPFPPGRSTTQLELDTFDAPAIASSKPIRPSTNAPANPVSPTREDSETVTSTFAGEVDTNPDFPDSPDTSLQTSYDVLPTPRSESGAEIRPVTGDQTADFKENACATPFPPGRSTTQLEPDTFDTPAIASSKPIRPSTNAFEETKRKYARLSEPAAKIRQMQSSSMEDIERMASTKAMAMAHSILRARAMTVGSEASTSGHQFVQADTSADGQLDRKEFEEMPVFKQMKHFIGMGLRLSVRSHINHQTLYDSTETLTL